VTVSISNDNIDFIEVGKLTRAFAANGNDELKDFKIDFNKTKARFLKVVATNLKKSPTGGGTWLFVDEIQVN